MRTNESCSENYTRRPWSDFSSPYTHHMDLTSLPGHELVIAGLRDLATGARTREALLVSIGAPRLRRSGLSVPASPVEDPEHALYAILAAEDPDAAHSRHNALIRQLVSLERALECAA